MAAESKRNAKGKKVKRVNMEDRESDKENEVQGSFEGACAALEENDQDVLNRKSS